MFKTRIKICGLTRVEDVEAAAAAGADAIGLIFYEQSKRAVSIQKASVLFNAIPPFVSSVGLFVNAPVVQVEDVLRNLPLSLLQFHGDETADYCESFGRPYIKVIRFAMGAANKEQRERSRELLNRVLASHPQAKGFLLDAYNDQQAGGTGEVFDWSIIPENISKPWVLAGGLNPANVKTAVAQTRPYAVDVSSGVERSPGVKDVKMINEFVAAVRG